MGWEEHIRLRNGMYIGRIGDGSDPRDGVYTIFKAILNNAVDEFRRGFGNLVEVTVDGNSFSVRDYGRGIERERLTMVLQEDKYAGSYVYTPDSESHGVPLTISSLSSYGLRVNIALSSYFYIESHKQGEREWFEKKNGEIVASGRDQNNDVDGTLVKVTPDENIFGPGSINQQFIESIIKRAVFLNKGLTIILNGKEYCSDNGLLDLVNERHLPEDILYPPIHLEGKNIEIVLMHTRSDSSDVISFVNGHFTVDGGTHQTAFKRAITTALNEFYNLDFKWKEYSCGITGAISINILDPTFVNAIKSSLASYYMDGDRWQPNTGMTKISTYVGTFIKNNLRIYLSEHPETAKVIQRKLLQLASSRKSE